MAHGIYIENPSGFVKVDETYGRYRILQQGSMNTPGPVYFTAQSQEPLIFCRPSSYGGKLRVGSLYTDRFWLYSGNASGAPEVAANYAVINRSDLVGVPSGYGLNVLAPDSKLLFSSQDKFVNVDTVITYTISSVTQTFDLPAPEFGQRYFAMLGPNITRSQWSANYMYIWAQAMTLLSETQIQISEQSMAPVYFPANLGASSILGAACTLISGYL